MNLEKEVRKLLKDAPIKEVFKYVNGTYVGRYYYKEATLYGQTYIEEVRADSRYIPFDKCNICHWRGPSAWITDNKCPQCGSTDLEDNTL